MIERELKIRNKAGLHARPSARVAQLAERFDSRVTLRFDGEEADAKSILGILLLAAPQGSRVLLRCEGRDEREAIEALTDLFQSGFGEET